MDFIKIVASLIFLGLSASSNGNERPCSDESNEGVSSCVGPFQNSPIVTLGYGDGVYLQGSQDFQAAGDAIFNFNDYGDALGDNKRLLESSLEKQGASPSEKRILVAIAMQESTHMSPDQRDKEKDGLLSENLSIFNMNVDMVIRLGKSPPFGYLNQMENLDEAVAIMLQGLRTWGVVPFLNFHRGGATAFQDGQSYGAYEYRNAIYTIYKVMVSDPFILRDNRRVEIWVPRV